ncbi:hypothetical protein [Vibrio anguillarum]|uniref:Uncharacterized protein n=1 Tax=Vibrio anguillarum TaxID=55601 RepID=A0ABR9Z7K5_VIBAN|nr:hypothetical protein [Vibrio anguillarum]MBF4374428.1 hypothetical protein [Vibrio anguillarum]
MTNREKRAKRAKVKAKQNRVAKQASRNIMNPKQNYQLTEESMDLIKSNFKVALEERLEKRLKTQTFSDLTIGGSRVRFEMEMAISDYPFELPDEALAEDYEALLPMDTYLSGIFDDVITAVFDSAKNKHQFT